MKFDEVKELIQLIDKSSLSFVELKSDDSYIKIDKSETRNSVLTSGGYAGAGKQSQQVEPQNVDAKDTLQISEVVEGIKPTEAKAKEVVNNEEDLEVITSPMVGTFYKAISPEEAPFVVEGQKVSKGQVLCIVEAMKLMNEIVAEYDCEIVSIVAQDSTMVEYSQPLFKVRR